MVIMVLSLQYFTLLRLIMVAAIAVENGTNELTSFKKQKHA